MVYHLLGLLASLKKFLVSGGGGGEGTLRHHILLFWKIVLRYVGKKKPTERLSQETM